MDIKNMRQFMVSRKEAAPIIPAINIHIQLSDNHKKEEEEKKKKENYKALMLKQALFQSELMKKNDKREDNLPRVHHVGGA